MFSVQQNSIVLVPRSGGGVSIGMVSMCDGTFARVRFPIGPTFRGEVNKESSEVWGSKIVPIQELRPIPENYRVSFNKR
ncbi:hypothetical protein [Bacteroides sp.]|uniref:hypothetical protein n=1 Tax=Bacteroides sp. TaxID=29523 RepID=UPI002604C946|nr:hypothetical protein [Bacteroides sp.]MDD3040440.1 hypothetical protein [Bacteroides sp.]